MRLSGEIDGPTIVSYDHELIHEWFTGAVAYDSQMARRSEAPRLALWHRNYFRSPQCPRSDRSSRN
jgi:hypothetical protein